MVLKGVSMVKLGKKKKKNPYRLALEVRPAVVQQKQNYYIQIK